ncbi:F-box only protein 18, partial [Ophiophagus hannah]
SSFEQLPPAVSDCEDPPQRPEGTAALKEPLSQSPDSRDSNGGCCPTPQKKDTHKDEEDTLPPPIKRLCFSQESSDSDGSAGQEVQEQKLLLAPEESSGDGTVNQEVQDVKVEPLPDAHSGPPRTTSGNDVPQGTMEKLLNEILQNLKGIDHALLTLRFILKRCVAALQSFHCPDPTAILVCLNRHSLFPKAELCIAKRLPDLDDCKEQPAYVRAVMAAIVLMAGSVCDVQELVSCLRRPSTTMSQTDTLEMLYCMATLLYAMRENKVWISNRAVLQPTSEQQQILNYALAPGERVKIVAFAGTGKTSTLIQYARKWSKLNFLYLAFSKTMVKKALKDFRGNCKSFHAFALEEIKEKSETNMEQDGNAGPNPGDGAQNDARRLLEVFATQKTFYFQVRCHLAIMDIILRQKCGVILVGDPHQQIYTFRGADNTGFKVHASRTFYLTQSFRFGYEIAYVGATLVNIYKKVRNKTLVGNKRESDVSEIHKEGKVARLSWTNKTVFENTMKIIDKNSSAKIHFLGGHKSIGLEIIHDLWKLLHPEREFCQLGFFVDVQ